MAPTIASNARTRRAASAQPTTKPVLTGTTRAIRRANSVQGSTCMASSLKPIQRTAKAAIKPRAIDTSVDLTLNETQSPSKAISKKPSSSKAVPVNPIQKKPDDAAAVLVEGGINLQRTRYGDARAAREDQMGVAMAAGAQAKGLIDDETAKNWATPWHLKGAIQLNWSQQILDKHNAMNGIVPEKVMSLKEAEAIKKKKDRDLEEWAAAYLRGEIDENGKPIASKTMRSKVKSKFQEKLERRGARKKEEEKKTKADSLHKVQDGRVTKKMASKKTVGLPTIPEASSPEPVSDAAPAPKKLAVKPASAPIKKKTSTKANPFEAPITPLPGYPSYSEYKYNELNALCRDRNIKSGGDEKALRHRLIRDDTLVVNGELHLRDAKNYACRKEHDRKAPVVEGAPIASPARYGLKKKTTKRAREGDEEDNEDELKPKGKKMKTS